jgi:hypothetical protein
MHRAASICTGRESCSRGSQSGVLDARWALDSNAPVSLFVVKGVGRGDSDGNSDDGRRGIEEKTWRDARSLYPTATAHITQAHENSQANLLVMMLSRPQYSLLCTTSVRASLPNRPCGAPSRTTVSLPRSQRLPRSWSSLNISLMSCHWAAINVISRSSPPHRSNRSQAGGPPLPWTDAWGPQGTGGRTPLTKQQVEWNEMN